MPQPDPIQSAPAVSRRKLWLAALVIVLAALGIIVEGALSRATNSTQLREWTAAQAIPTVAVVAPVLASDGVGLELPGRLEAYIRAPIYARVPGYLKNWKDDIGAKVKAGDLLAEIETPDLDQQLLQAKADLATAQANLDLAEITAKRWQAMLSTDSVSRQEADEKTGDFAAKKALVAAARANVDRLAAMENFTRIIAPFDGTITTRNTDIGALVNVGSSTGQELFVVSDTTKLRLYVQVPQNYVPSVPPGTKATIRVPEHQDKSYAATVEYSAQAVNATSGTTLMQLLVDNAKGELMPGGYASVRFTLPDSGAANLTIPASALIFDAKGLVVATVGADRRVVLKPVKVAHDLGKTIEIASGLNAGDQVIESPPDGIADGSEVRIAGKAATARNKDQE